MLFFSNHMLFFWSPFVLTVPHVFEKRRERHFAELTPEAKRENSLKMAKAKRRRSGATWAINRTSLEAGHVDVNVLRCVAMLL